MANNLVEKSNKASQSTWEFRAVGGHRSQAKKHTKEYFDDITNYRYGYETPFISKVFNFNNLKDKSVLEVGVGHGIDAVLMMKSGAIYSGIDITKNHINLTKKNIELSFEKAYMDKNFKKLIHGEITDTSFDDKYDVVYSFGVLHHIEHELNVLKKIKSILKEDGELRFSVYASKSFFSIYMFFTWIFKNRMRNTLKEWVSHLAEDSEINEPVVIKIRSKKEIFKLLEEANFQVVNYSRKGFVQGYIPLIGKYLKPDGVILNFLGSFLGWYHCFTCKVNKD